MGNHVKGVRRWTVPIEIDVVPNSFVDYGVFAKVGIVHVVVQPLPVRFEEDVEGRGQVVDGGIDNFAVRRKAPC